MNKVQILSHAIYNPTQASKTTMYQVTAMTTIGCVSYVCITLWGTCWNMLVVQVSH